MAKTIKQLHNGLRIKFIVGYKRHFLYSGNQSITIDGEWQNGFDSVEEAEEIGNTLEIDDTRFKWSWTSNKITNES